MSMRIGSITNGTGIAGIQEEIAIEAKCLRGARDSIAGVVEGAQYFIDRMRVTEEQMIGLQGLKGKGEDLLRLLDRHLRHCAHIKALLPDAPYSVTFGWQAKSIARRLRSAMLLTSDTLQWDERLASSQRLVTHAVEAAAVCGSVAIDEGLAAASDYLDSAETMEKRLISKISGLVSEIDVKVRERRRRLLVGIGVSALAGIAVAVATWFGSW